MMGNFGKETMVIGEATERIDTLNGVRVRYKNDDFGDLAWHSDHTSYTGEIYAVLVNRENQIAQIWVNMDAGGARCFRPHHLTLVDGKPVSLPERTTITAE